MSWLRNTLIALGTLTSVTLAAQAADATPGYVTSSVSLRAGPSTSYPRVVLLQRGALVDIHGCINGFTWCDIDWRGYRGWAPGRYLQVLYRQHRGPITSYGSYLSIPFIGFDIDIYWNNYYHSRPFFGTLPHFHKQGFKTPGGQPPNGGNACPQGEHFVKGKCVSSYSSQGNQLPQGNLVPNGNQPPKSYQPKGMSGPGGCHPGQTLKDGKCVGH
jgi:uncharacterized protein YraI